MTAECQGCSNRFFVQGAGTEEVACPDCGGQLQPERDQPGGTNSDFEARNMVDPYTQKDMGGIPEQDGIWAKIDGGWKPPYSRDEMVGSVKTADVHHVENVVPGPDGLHNGPLSLLNKLMSVQVNGVHVNPQTGPDLFMQHGRRDTPQFRQPVTISAHHPAFAELAAQIVRDGHGNPAAYGEQVQALQQGISQGQIPKPVDESGRPILAGVKVADWYSPYDGYLDQTIHTPWGLPRTAAPWDWAADRVHDVYQTVNQFGQNAQGPNLDNVGQGPKVPSMLDRNVDATDALSLTPAVVPRAVGAVGAVAATKVAPKVLKAIRGGGKAATGTAAKAALIKAMSGGGGDQGAPAMPVQAPTLQQVTHVHSFDTTPTSLDKIPNSDETGDTLEFSDQSHDLNPENPNDDESQGANLTPETVNLFNQSLPKLMEWLDADNDGQIDPELQALADALERDGVKIEDDDFENVEDEKQNDDPLADGNVDEDDDVKHTAAIPIPSGQPGNAIVPPRPAPAVGPNPAQQACPVCGSNLNAALATCPQCGYNPQDPQAMNRAVTPGVTAKTADTQGPANPEQFKAVAEVLIQQNRAEEIPHMFEAPWEYADILAQVQNDQNPPPPAVEQPAQPPMDPSMMGMDPNAMPPGAAPPGAAPPGPGGMPPGLARIQSAVARFSADNIAPKCPRCDSHTTGIVSDDGDCACHNCGNQWSTKAERTSRIAAPAVDTSDIHAEPDQEDHLEDHQEPEAGKTWETSTGEELQVGQEYELHSSKYPIPDIVKVVEVKPTEIVVSTTGEFAELEDQITISKQEAINEDYTFVPSAGQDPEAGNQSADEYLHEEAAGAPRQNTNPTQTTGVPFTSSTSNTSGATNVTISWNDKLKPGHPRAKLAADPSSIDQAAFDSITQQGGVTIGLDGTQPTQGFAFSPFKHWEMRIPQDQFDLAHVTQYISQHQEALQQPNNYLGAWVADNEVWLDISQVLPDRDQALQAAAAAGQTAIFDLATFEEIPVPNGEAPEGATENLMGTTASAPVEGLDWLREGGIQGAPAPWQNPLPDLLGKDIFDPTRGEIMPKSGDSAPQVGEATGPEWLMDGAPATSRMAGKRFSPSEQKKFIDEDGEARNLDRLDLEGTHYKLRDSGTDVFVAGRGEMRYADPSRVPDDHLLFGMAG